MDIIIKKIIISIQEEDLFNSSINIEYLKLLYKKKDLNISLNKFIVKTNPSSNIILYMFRLNPTFLSQYKNSLSFEKENNNGNILNNELEKNNNNDNNNWNISNKFNFDKLFNDILNGFNYKIDIFSFIFHSYSLIIFLNINNISGNKIKENNYIYNSFENWNFVINYLNDSYEKTNKKVIENIKKTIIIYDLKSILIKGQMKSVYFNTDLKEIFEIWENISFLFNQSDSPLKFDFQIDDLVLTSDKFIYSISNMLIRNFVNDIVIKDNFFIKLYEFKMCNNENIKMIYEKEIDINYILSSKNEDNIIINCNNVNCKLCQNDISYILIDFDLPENENDYKKFKTSDININDKNKLFDFQNTNEDSKNNLNFKTKSSMEEYQKEINKKFSITAKINIPILKLSFCLN